ncbi:MAG: hypothetical protein OXL34_01585 [Gemmatimonadota bacterium]|nr:hypothetical protein [Gemmatimonadota bacterium]
MALGRSWLVSRLVLAANPFGLTDSDLLELFGSPDKIGMAALKLREGVLSAVLTAKDNFDAFVAALVTRAAAIGCCEEIPPEDCERAKKEGWIALPKSGSLGRLAANCPDS